MLKEPAENLHVITVSVPGDVILQNALAQPLAGKLSYPAILFFPGLDHVDRDENNPRLNTNIIKLLAQIFSTSGRTALRYDKRGIGGSGGDYFDAGLWTLVDDAARALNFLQYQPEVDAHKVFLLGHSEGAMQTAALARRESIAGLMLLPGTVANLRDIVT